MQQIMRLEGQVWWLVPIYGPSTLEGNARGLLWLGLHSQDLWGGAHRLILKFILFIYFKSSFYV